MIADEKVRMLMQIEVDKFMEPYLIVPSDEERRMLMIDLLTEVYKSAYDKAHKDCISAIESAIKKFPG
jgi:hypothetical protein